jgi:hypothetical protein
MDILSPREQMILKRSIYDMNHNNNQVANHFNNTKEPSNVPVFNSEFAEFEDRDIYGRKFSRDGQFGQQNWDSRE